MTETDSNADHDAQGEAASGESSRGSTRAVALGFALVTCFVVAMLTMRALTPGATLYVEADESATALLKSRGVKIKQTDGHVVQTLLPGRQSVRAGKYRLTDEVDGVRLEFSTGQTFEIAKGEKLTIRVTGYPSD